MRRRERWILMLGVGGLGLCGLSMLMGWRGLVALGTLAVGLGGLLSMARCREHGLLRTPRGVLRRVDNPLEFRCRLAWGGMSILLWIAGGALFSLGVIGPR
ncbi:MAG TPA: hypothetical protein VE981_12995 [Planctomycetota bacterium]|nr:hypothetical protein [Planctomycetota bacterium]